MTVYTEAGLTEKKYQKLLEIKHEVDEIQERKERILEQIQVTFLQPILKNEDKQALEVLYPLLPEDLKTDLRTIRLQWGRVLISEKPDTSLEKEHAEKMWSHSPFFKQKFGSSKKNILNSLYTDQQLLNYNNEHFIVLLSLCNEHFQLNNREEKLDTLVFTRFVEKTTDKEKLEKLITLLPPLYSRFQARDILYSM